LIVAIQKPVHETTADANSFTLTIDQMIFMMNAINAIEQAEEEDDKQFFTDLKESAEYKTLFGEMSIDQAIDRFELTLDE
jgi:hypothetical protein